ncbi:type II toxin-antitoxin system Phd/YefM family antitoxin [Pseudoalteromonas sp. NZS127_1]|uniref:type II toxin-antitoxin system Phd/YefM family antitoxin n=1 Tax=unclassified Pseudoalteromonas TaxID=194690 RepID=UPI00140D165B|nr:MULTISPECIES: type II toxin-antitoxin system Phd/YefM family antitoxin [unclassified Pseudoalteromonas]MBG9993827.1 type II toxin-antitoxin system Phd/YefM family antitoxin [Pseudoalteromonas sp. NZS127_1]
MTTRILTEMAASISELKANPMRVALSGNGEPIAVLNRNEPAFYCIPAEAYEYLMDRIEDLELITLAEKRKSEESVKVNLNDL